MNPKETNTLLVSLRRFAEENNVPIITLEGIHFLKQLIQLKRAKNILEIGTAIAYSTIQMAMIDSVESLTTIERDPLMVLNAKSNIKQSKLAHKITLIEGDALNVSLSEGQTFDLIFIDAAKAQSQRFFEKYEPFLSEDGIIVTDNLLFHGMVENPENITSRNLKQLVRKIDAFNHYLMQKEGYDTIIYPIGDGMSVSIKRK